MFEEQYDEYYEGMKKLREENEKLKEQLRELQQQTRWNPVSERLPENGKQVLIRVKSSAKGWNFLAYCRDGIWNISFGSPKESITHWMPLPQPPQGEAHE
jgi:hypothetical protein